MYTVISLTFSSQSCQTDKMNDGGSNRGGGGGGTKAKCVMESVGEREGTRWLPLRNQSDHCKGLTPLLLLQTHNIQS